MHLILDLDETCISALPTQTALQHADKLDSFDIYSSDGSRVDFKAYKRPYLDEFLKWALECTNLSIWSAGDKDYVLDIVQSLTSDDKKIKIIMWRDHCNQCEADTKSLKSIAWLKKRVPIIETLGYPVLVDDLKENCVANKMNSINIPRFDAREPNCIYDAELKTLRDKLDKMHTLPLDMTRSEDKEYWLL